MNNTPQAGLHCNLTSLIDWPMVMSQPRYAGGHEEVMRNIFGRAADVIGWWSDNDYQGTVAIAYELASDGRVVLMTDYYGSCSGCDMWEDSSDASAREMIINLVNGAKVFPSRETAKDWIKSIDSNQNPEQYPWEAIKNLVIPHA